MTTPAPHDCSFMTTTPNDPRNVVWKCGHVYRVNAPDFNPDTDVAWCADHDCPNCRLDRAIDRLEDVKGCAA